MGHEANAQHPPPSTAAAAAASCHGAGRAPPPNGCPLKRVVLSHLEGTLLRSRSFFPYYMLMSLEASNPIRAFLLLLLHPITWAISVLLSETLSTRIQIFLSVAGVPESEVLAVSRAVLPKFFLDDLGAGAYRQFLGTAPSSSSGDDKYVLTSHPRIFVQHFLRHHLAVKEVIGSELQTTRSGICTGLVSSPGVLDESAKLEAVRSRWPDYSSLSTLVWPQEMEPRIVGLRNPSHHHSFLAHCQDIVNVCTSGEDRKVVPKDEYVNPLVFHDGRLVMRPTPFVSLAIFLWAPVGVMLALARIMVVTCLPIEISYPLSALLGIKVRVSGGPPLFVNQVDRGGNAGDCKEGAIFACTHRTVADPIYLAGALRRKVHALGYSLSKFSVLISPLRTTLLSRNREEDARLVGELLVKEDVFICPEGTTCREPFLLRFSPLFADVTDNVVPVAFNVELRMFQGTSVRGYKAFDPITLFSNPRPFYEVIFLDPLPMDKLRAQGMSAIEIANMTQKLLADKLGFQCTNFNRKDKYTMLAGNDGTVKKKRVNVMK